MLQQKISFEVSKEDARTITEIAQRAVDVFAKYGVRVSQLDIMMDLTAVHANGNPLRLRELLEADTFNFLHDIEGIKRYLNRKSGKLLPMFSPRFSA